MANTTVSGGLRMYKANNSENLEQCIVRAGDATALFQGDAVVIDATDGAAQLGTGPLVQEVKAASNSGAIYGVVVGTLPQMDDTNNNPDLSKTYRPASTAMYLLVRRANNQDIYAIMDDGAVASGANSALGAINVGFNANLSVATAGSTITGQSNMRLGGASIDTTATLQLKIIGFVDDPKNDPTATFARWLVTINNCQTNTGGTGVVGV